jgi:glutathione S-transferase
MGARLITIPISHFCEKARWALDRAGVSYEERRHLQFVHIAAAKLAGGGRTVPVFVAADGRAIGDSSEILRWCDQRLEPGRRLYPGGELGAAAAALEDRYDEGLGPDGRLWMYEQTLPVIERMKPWATAGVPGWERAFFRLGGPAVAFGLRRYLSVDAAESAAALTRVRAVFDDAGERLADGRRFLLGDRFSAADLTFAALAAPMVLPEAYGSPLPGPGDVPEAMAAEVERLREHPAGRFATRLYAEERRPVLSGAASS